MLNTLNSNCPVSSLNPQKNNSLNERKTNDEKNAFGTRNSNSAGSPVHPESGPSSYERRGFIKKATIAAAALGVGAIIVDNAALPKSSAKVCHLDVITAARHTPGTLAVWGCHCVCPTDCACLVDSSTTSQPMIVPTSRKNGALNVLNANTCLSETPVGTYSIIEDQAAFCGFPAPPGATAVLGVANKGIGVFGTSCSGIGIRACSNSGQGVSAHSVSGTGVVGTSNSGVGVEGVAGCPGSVPIVATGAAAQTANLQQWENHCGHVLSVINKKGWLGIGNFTSATATRPLNAICVFGGTISACSGSCLPAIIAHNLGCASTPAVLGASCRGVGVEGLACCAGAVPIVARARVGGQTANLQQWEKGCPGIVLSVVNKCGNFGIRTANPQRVLCVNGRGHFNCGLGLGTQTINTTLALNGGMSARAKIVKTTYQMLANDFAVLANASSAFTVTLPLASTGGSFGTCIRGGMVVFVKNIGTATVTLSPKSGDNIEGSTSGQSLAAKAGITLIADGVHTWWIQSTSS